MKKTQVPKDPFAIKLIKDLGGVENFKAKIKGMVVQTLAEEKEAYKAGSNARKSARDFTGEDYNDLVPLTIGMMQDALSV